MESQYAGLLALLRRKLRDEQLAQDTLNDAIVTCLTHLQSGRIASPELIGGYIFQVAMNHLRNHRRKMIERADRHVGGDVIEDLPADAAPTPGDSLDLAALVREVLEALQVARDREIVKRFYLDEEEKEAICQHLRLSPLHFDKVVYRARQRMRALLESRGFRKSDLLGLLLLMFLA
jgi:RNA polymerase sigma-70 factor, ECF subfamily